MKEKLKVCKVCGKEMATNAKACPSCGAKNKKPVFKKWWFWLIVVVIVAAVGAGAGGSGEAPQGGGSQQDGGSQQQPISYTAYEVSQLMDDLSGNAMKAESTYKNQYVALSGRLGVIDSSGKYISIYSADDPFDFIGVTCYLKNDAQRQQVMEMSVGDVITVRGKITSVGEVLGYSLNVTDFGE